MRSTPIRTALLLAAAATFAACGSSTDSARRQRPSSGAVDRRAVSVDSVKSVDVFVLRVNARLTDASETEAADSVDDKNHGGMGQRRGAEQVHRSARAARREVVAHRRRDARQRHVQRAPAHHRHGSVERRAPTGPC